MAKRIHNTKVSVRVYLDYASTTPVAPEVVKAMAPYWGKEFGNPGAFTSEGLSAHKALEDARVRIARLMDASPREIIFTSGATEANNLAIYGVAQSLLNYCKSHNEKSKPHIITSSIEHASVIEPIKKLEREGVAVTWLPVYQNGIVRVQDAAKALRPETVLVSVMYANNEIGTIQPIKEIAHIIRKHRQKEDSCRVLFHTDAAQAPGSLPIDTRSLGVDLLSLTAQKFYGPKGVGLLFCKGGTQIAPQTLGGHQERGLRAGTENVPLIIGMAKALEIAEKSREKESARLMKLRDYFISKVLKEIPDAILNGDPTERLASNINFSFPGLHNELTVIELDIRGVSVATGSACMTASTEPNHVIVALRANAELRGFDAEEMRKRADSAVRFSLGRSNKKQDLDYVLRCIKEIIAKQSVIPIY